MPCAKIEFRHHEKRRPLVFQLARAGRSSVACSSAFVSCVCLFITVGSFCDVYRVCSMKETRQPQVRLPVHISTLFQRHLGLVQIFQVKFMAVVRFSALLQRNLFRGKVPLQCIHRHLHNFLTSRHGVQRRCQLMATVCVFWSCCGNVRVNYFLQLYV